MNPTIICLIAIIIIALIFEFTNGFHDAANVVSTVIATKALRPFVAICIASILNFLGATQISKVAETIISGFLHPNEVSSTLLISALCGAISWNIFTWYLKIPSSSSYALIGGLIGSSYFLLGLKSIYWTNILYKVVIPMILSPLLGIIISYLFMNLLNFLILKKYLNQNQNIFKKLQIFSSSLVALSHGFNDAQKTMAIITLALFSSKLIFSLSIPIWVILICSLTMALGTAIGGLRIVKTVGFEITSLNNYQGFIAESTASILIILASLFGYPLSSTHIIVGSITGTALEKDKKIEKKTMKKIAWAWLLSLPGSAFFAWICSLLLGLKF